MGPPGVNELSGLISLGAAVFHGHFASGCKSAYGLAFRYKFHGYIPIKAQLAELAVDIWVVDLAGTGIVAARDVGDVHNADEVEILSEFCEEGAFGNLVVEEIV